MGVHVHDFQHPDHEQRSTIRELLAALKLIQPQCRNL